MEVPKQDMPQEPIPMPQEPMPDDGGMPEMDMPDEGGEVPQQDEPGDSEIEQIFSGLDTEQQAQVIKYAKSISGGNPEPEEGQMQESEGIVTEITNNILSDKENPVDKEDKKVRNKNVTKTNPFVSKQFRK